MRRRIQWVGVLAAALAIALFGLPLAASVVVLFHANERAELERLAEAAAARAAPGLAQRQDGVTLPRTDEDTRVAIYRLDGTRVEGAGPVRADLPVRRARTGQVTEDRGGKELVVAVPVTSNEQVIAVVRAASPRSRVRLRIALTWLSMTGLAAAALGAAALLARRQARRIAAPLEHVAAAAADLGGGDFTVRPPPAGIAEIDAVAAALGETAQRLGELVGRERAFSADASHQLRTPLTGLRLRLETALDDDAGLRPAVLAALDSADRLERTIDELLALARDAPTARVPVDLPVLLTDLDDTWRTSLAAAGRQLHVTMDPGLPPTAASAAATRQILDVLLTNAVQHGSGTVTVRARPADTAIALDVSDEGPGVPVPDRDLFRRRARGEGHGIGLALARALAEAEGGRLVLTHPGPHPRFTLLLPARA